MTLLCSKDISEMLHRLQHDIFSKPIPIQYKPVRSFKRKVEMGSPINKTLAT
jgi:hypothetical protein